MAMRGVDTVIHAAALKIIPTCEYNPYESVQTNVIGAQNVCKAAIEAGVRVGIMVSTDKAASPLNCYGACKLVAEKLFLGSNHMSAGEPHFSAVRYGNVDGSQGSVMPFFKKLVAEGKRLVITDHRMTRFSISMDKAIDLVLAAVAGCQMMPGTIWIPKLPSFKVVDLAAALSNKKPLYIGIRPGEKLHETLITEDESRITEDHGTYYIINGKYGSSLPDGFTYNSGTNTEWLGPEALMEICRHLS
jgi:UDP-N-acetylglucosamine 4,6-dehydratase